MKKLVLYSGLLLFSVAVLVNCKPTEKPPSALDQAVKSLTGTWKCSGAKLGGVNQVDYIDKFTITITGSAGNTSLSFTTQGRNVAPPTKSVWPVSGTFTIDSTNPGSALKRDDNTSISYSVSGTGELNVRFTYNGDGFSRINATNAIKGDWVFTFPAKS